MGSGHVPFAAGPGNKRHDDRIPYTPAELTSQLLSARCNSLPSLLPLDNPLIAVAQNRERFLRCVPL
jgi:hypothetical protein